MSTKYTLAKDGVKYADLLVLLKKYFGDIPFSGKNTFINRPVIVDANLQNEYARLSHILNHVLQKIVLNYFVDERIRKIYQLDDELESILKLTEGLPYKIGMYRPDIIFETNGQPKICEIGCRYPINGWMISHYTRLIFSALENQTTPWISNPYSNHFITQLLKDLDTSQPLYYVHHLEKGNEAYQLFKELAKEKVEVIDITPSDLILINGKLTVNQQQATQFILEMDREELKTIDSKVLKQLMVSKCINDIRSLVLIHDKNILSVLYDEAIIKDYINEEDHRFLKQFLIPSYTLSSKTVRTNLIDSSYNWILKKSSGGRGIDMYIKEDSTPKAWAELIETQWKNYMAQTYVNQKTFDLQRNGSTQNINLVGMLLCYNEQSYGLGIFRGSTKSIINVHSGGYILPCAISKT